MRALEDDTMTSTTSEDHGQENVVYRWPTQLTLRRCCDLSELRSLCLTRLQDACLMKMYSVFYIRDSYPLTWFLIDAAEGERIRWCCDLQSVSPLFVCSTSPTPALLPKLY